jgi:hypothetical protein
MYLIMQCSARLHTIRLQLCRHGIWALALPYTKYTTIHNQLTISCGTSVSIFTSSSSSKPHKLFNVLSCKISIRECPSSRSPSGVFCSDSENGSHTGIPFTGYSVETLVLVSTRSSHMRWLTPVLIGSFRLY